MVFFEKKENLSLFVTLCAVILEIKVVMMALV